MKCTNCKREAELFSGVKASKLYSDLCERCIGVLGSSELSRNYDRTWQRRHYAKDILQPDDKDYAKVYGANQARERGWSEEQIRKNT